MAQQGLRGLDRLSHLREQRRVCVPEGMPRYARLFDPVTCGRELTVVEVLRAERRPRSRSKNQILRRIAWFAGAIGFELAHEELAHWDHAITAPSFRQAEGAVRKGLGDFQCAALCVYTFPPQSENLTDSHSGEDGELDDRATGLSQLDEELSHLSR